MMTCSRCRRCATGEMLLTHSLTSTPGPDLDSIKSAPRQVSSLRKSTREEVRELTKTLQATLAEMQGLVDAKTGELAESAHRNVQLGARVSGATALPGLLARNGSFLRHSSAGHVRDMQCDTFQPRTWHAIPRGIHDERQTCIVSWGRFCCLGSTRCYKGFVASALWTKP